MGPSFQASIKITSVHGPLSHVKFTANRFQQLAEATRQIVAPVLESARFIAKWVKATVISPLQHFLNSIRHFLSWWKPIIWVDMPLDQEFLSGIPPDLELDRQDGYFLVFGKKLEVLHSRTSKTGRFLHKLLMHRAEIVPYEEIQSYIGSCDRVKAFKNLKEELRRRGYELNYTLIRTEGIALHSIQAVN